MRRPEPRDTTARWQRYADFLEAECVRQAKIGNGAMREIDSLREQLRGAVVVDDAAITRAADAIGKLGTDRIGAEPYAAARVILAAA